ncbi:sensor histidine kinase [Polyangium jinanense]|uniref:histidine kinase n=1 Tax=Polyangium jinanense TaxID=2829994 RepID=A0A9X3XEZ5_9BACT|nr:HAMP domain-containing sensor histidine kinase [Polyangium jinanense]MDC3957412.1 HAMP domain-containing histidine kinase [Polyangium jinanense]MDC3988200.1 HAMP domain-containing histidine kinase [Polyangium jinanense]
MAVSSSPQAYRLRGRLLLTVSLLVALVLASGASAVVSALASRRAILKAHDLEVASRRAALLSVVAREQYIHEAHTIILRDPSHIAHHDKWVDKLNDELRALRPMVDDAGEGRLDAIADASCDLSCVFTEEILPAIDRKDWAEVHRSHERANALVDRMTEHADAVAGYFDGEALKAEGEAASAVRLALVIAVGTGLLAAAVALVAGRNLWRSFATPLGSLERVARRVAEGDRTARVEPVPAVELAVVADAINRMLDTLKRAEADLVAAERLAAIGRVAAGVAHEINNPVTVIRGYLSTMREEVENDSMRDELRILDEEAALCQRIAEELLVYARTPALVPRPVDAADLLRDAADRAESVPSRRPISSGSPTVVVDAEPAMIRVDSLRIRQVIVNLVSNAREAMSSDEPVLVEGHREGDGYRFEVLDRGEGLSSDVIDHVFEPFFTTRRDGTGLGLAVCYGLVTAHGGRIRAEARAGGGARFVVDLPGVIVDAGKEEAA